MRLIILATISVLVRASNAEKTYIESFKDLEGTLLWPVPASTRKDISSTFGPRVKVSTNDYDFHRGIDIHGEIGDQVISVADGLVKRVTNYANGGLTVVLEHSFDEPTKLHPDKGSTTKWYTLYMHLSKTMVREGRIIKEGKRIGSVGQTGASVSPHLHHEVRVGTRCSLEYALENPKSTCNTKEYDPHVHPMLIYKRQDRSPSMTLLSNIGRSTDGMVRVSTSDEEPNINTYLFKVIANDSSVKQSYTLDLSLRTGYNANSTKALDTPDKTRPYLNPVPFGYTADVWDIDFIIPAGWVREKVSGDVFVVTAIDVWGKETSFTFG